jgi:hypothetical protein
MTKQENMGEVTHSKANNRAIMILLIKVRKAGRATVNNQGFMARVSGNNSNRTNRAAHAINNINTMTNRNMSSRREKIIKGKLKKLSTTSSKMQIKTQGIIKSIRKRCFDVKPKGRKRIRSIGKISNGSMKKDLDLMATYSMTGMIQFNRRQNSLELLFMLLHLL